MNKKFYIKHLLKIALANKVRLSLTILGVFTAVLAFFLGNITSNSYYKNKLKYIQEMDSKTLILTTMDKSGEEVLEKCQNPIEIRKLTEEQPMEVISIGDDKNLIVKADLCGISNTENVIIGKDDSGKNIPVKSKLFKGRHINDTDLRHKELVAVINKFTEKSCFNGDALGKDIRLINGNKTLKLKVVGVVENTLSDNKDIQEMKKTNTDKLDELYITVNVYCPVSTITEYFDNISDKRYFCNFEDELEYVNYEEYIEEKAQTTKNNEIEYMYTTKTELLESLEKEMQSTKMLIKVALVMLSIISGVTIMSVTFFSVKERIPEIGIRKAFGAKKRDILGQFMVEMLIMGAFASIVALIIGFILCKILENFISKKLFMDFSVYYEIKQFILPVCLGLGEIVGFAIIPSFYAANINVIKSLKFD